MRLQPQSRLSELIDEIEDLRDQGSASRELEIRRIKKQAEEFKVSDPAAGFSLLGMIACLENNLEEMHRCHKISLQYSNDAAVDLGNYAVSLMSCRLLEDALYYAKRAYDVSASDLARRAEALDLLVCITSVLDDAEEEFLDYLETWEDLTGESHPILESNAAEEDEQKLTCIIGALEEDICTKREEFVQLDNRLFEKAEKLIRGI